MNVTPCPVPAWFEGELGEMGIELEPGDAERLGRFLAILLHANEQLNLTSITETDEAWRKHIFDSLSLIPVLAELPEHSRVADVGSGGGLPAIPLAITLPALRFALIEATGKKAAFLGAVAEAMQLTNVLILNERAEEIGQHHKSQNGRESYDLVMARALGRLNVAVELTVPLAKVGGQIVLVKGAQAEAELEEAAKAIELLGADHNATLPTPTGKLVVLEKVARTPRTYPRPSGEPKRKPL